MTLLENELFISVVLAVIVAIMFYFVFLREDDNER